MNLLEVVKGHLRGMPGSEIEKAWSSFCSEHPADDLCKNPLGTTSFCAVRDEAMKTLVDFIAFAKPQRHS